LEEVKTVIFESFFTQVSMLITALITLILGIYHRNKFYELRMMAFYPLASLLQSGIYYYWIYTARNDNWKVGRIGISVFILVEFLIFLKFFNDIIILNNLRKKIKVIAVTFFIYLISMWIFTDAFYKNPSKVYLPESLCVLFFCFMYFFQIFRLPPELSLLNSPSFWITIGCLFYFSCTIPLFFAYQILFFLPNYYSIFSINYLAYTILFIFISKAFLCNPVPTK
jgi:hypothetical protein